MAAVVIPTPALAGYVAAGNQVLREANSAAFVDTWLHVTGRPQSEIGRIGGDSPPFSKAFFG